MNTKTLDFNVWKWVYKYYINGFHKKEHAVYVLMRKRKCSAELHSSPGVPLLLLHPSFQTALIDYQLNSFKVNKMYLLKSKKKVTISYSKPLPQRLNLPFPVTFLPGAICCLEILAINMHFLLLNLVSNSNSCLQMTGKIQNFCCVGLIVSHVTLQMSPCYDADHVCLKYFFFYLSFSFVVLSIRVTVVGETY